jgi:hypothetical protein
MWFPGYFIECSEQTLETDNRSLYVRLRAPGEPRRRDSHHRSHTSRRLPTLADGIIYTNATATDTIRSGVVRPAIDSPYRL